MSSTPYEDKMPQNPADTEGDFQPARKRAVKASAAKSAVKSAIKSAPKKVAVKRAAVKKVKVPEPAEIQVVIESVPLKRATRVKKPVASPEESPSVHDDEVQRSFADTEKPKRFGRVPGGGPVVSPEAQGAVSRDAADVPARDPSDVPGDPSFSDSQAVGRPVRGAPPQNFQTRDGQTRDGQTRDGQSPHSRSKRRRDKRKNRNERHTQGEGAVHGKHPSHGKRPDALRADGAGGDFHERRAAPVFGPQIATEGLLELAPKGFGFLRVVGNNFEPLRDDVFVTPEMIRRYNLRVGQWLQGLYQSGSRGPQLVELTAVNGIPPEEAAKLPHFDELKAINPARRISFETTPERFTTRVVDIMAPVGRGQRGLIVSPPRSGKTTLLLHMAEAIREKYEDSIHLMVLLVDERPEEVTEFRRALPGAEIYASSNDEQPRNHCRIAELAIERAKRLVEAGKDVFMVMDSITRLARAYNNTMNNRGRGTGSGGITIGALEVPRRLFAAARNTRGGGSLTILATALIQTNSRADEAIFMEFKGTGNMELVLDRKIAENYIYPAVDIFKSGTRREEILIPDHMLHKVHLIRRGLAGHRPAEAMERLLFFLKKFPNNPQMLLEIKG